jgi:hypothetical protein
MQFFQAFLGKQECIAPQFEIFLKMISVFAGMRGTFSDQANYPVFRAVLGNEYGAVLSRTRKAGKFAVPNLSLWNECGAVWGRIRGCFIPHTQSRGVIPKQEFGSGEFS